MENSNWLSDFLQARAEGIFDSALFAVILFVLSSVAGRLSRASIVSRISLRTRIIIGILPIVGISVAALRFGVSPGWAVVGCGFASIAFIIFALRGLAHLGISNAFAKTSEGISAERSLKFVRRELAFLGIGASKLTSSEEFSKALERCKREGRDVRFLLSDPNNRELMRLADQNNKNDTAYRSRVEQSIREIFHHGDRIGVKFEVRLYELDNEMSLSKFRMMFVDDRLCLLSHVVWSENEGSDNSQILIARTSSDNERGLYHAYKDFFDDLWKANSSRTVTREMIDNGLVR